MVEGEWVTFETGSLSREVTVVRFFRKTYQGLCVRLGSCSLCTSRVPPSVKLQDPRHQSDPRRDVLSGGFNQCLGDSTIGTRRENLLNLSQVKTFVDFLRSRNLRRYVIPPVTVVVVDTLGLSEV